MGTRSGVVFRNESHNSPFGMEGNSVPVVANNGGERDDTMVERANVVDNGTHANFQDFMKFITESRELKWLGDHQHNARVARWALALQPFEFIIAHRRGREKLNAHILSRREA